MPTTESAPPPCLLGAGDPPPVERVNPGGGSAILFSADHAGRAIPSALGRLGLPESALDRHIAWDIGAASVARRLAERFDAALVLAPYSRLVVDCNRAPGDPTSIPLVSDGTAIPGNRGLNPADRVARLTEIFWPYHNAVGAGLRRIADAGRAPMLVSIHSFTPVMQGVSRPWDIGILWKQDGRLPVPLLHRLRERRDLLVGDNQPYSGRAPAGFTIEHHADPAALPHVCVEFRQDLIADPAGQARWAGIFGDALAAVLAQDGGVA